MVTHSGKMPIMVTACMTLTTPVPILLTINIKNAMQLKFAWLPRATANSSGWSDIIGKTLMTHGITVLGILTTCPPVPLTMRIIGPVTTLTTMPIL